MTTEEKLFVQIFDRKNWIIEQVKQQTDMYIQNLASKLLVDGITPPPWIWNPNSLSHSSDPKELNKEELISKLLFQNPRDTAPYVSGHCSLYDKPVVTRDNAGLSGRYCIDTHASSKKIDESMSRLESRDNDVGCALNGVPELDFSVNSPQDETDARISNIYSAPDQSLARIQRSRSRQKALELRTSAKAAPKSCLGHEDRTGICFSGNSLSRIDFQQASQDKGSSKSARHYDVSGKNTGWREANEDNCGEGFRRSNYSDGITKSRSPYNQAVSVTEFHKDVYLEVAKDDGCVLLQPAHNDREWKETANTSDATSGSSVAREETKGKCRDKHQGSDNICGRITRSRSSSLQAHYISRSSQPGASTYTAEAGSPTHTQSMQKSVEQVVHSDKLLKAVIPSGELIGEKTGSSVAREETEGKCRDKQHGSDHFCGRITRSRSSSLQAHYISRSSQPGTSTYTAKAGSATLTQSMQKSVEHVLHSDMLLKAVIPSGELIGKKTRSQTTSSTEDTSLPVKSSGIAARRITRSRSGATKESPLAKSLKKNEGYCLPNVSGCQLVPLCHIADGNQDADAEIETQFVEGHAEAQPLYFGPNLDSAPLRKDSEGLVLSPSSNCHMIVQPKQLDFGDMEECNLNKNFSPSSRKERVNSSSGETEARLDTLASPDEVAPDSPSEGFVEEQSQMLRNVPTKPEEAQNDANVEECSEDEICKYRSEVNKNPVVNTGECNPEAALHNQVSSLEDPAPSDFLNNSDKEAHLENFEAIEGYWPSSKLRIEEGEFGRNKNSSATTPSKSIPKLAEPSVISSLAKQRTDDFQNCLDKEVGIPEPTGVDAAKQLHVQDMQNILHAENKDICPERMLVESNTDVGEGGVSAHCLIGPQCADDNYASFSGPTEVQFAKSSLFPIMKMNPTKGESWPPSKRRKVEDQLFSGFSALPSLRVQMPHNIQRSSTCRYLEKNGSLSYSGEELQVLNHSEEGKLSGPNANKSSDVGTYHGIQYPMMSDIDLSPSLQVKEGEGGSEVDNETFGTPFTFNDYQSRPSYLQSLTVKAADGSTDSLGEGRVETADPTITLGDARNLFPGYKVSVVNAVNLTAERNFPKRISHVTGDGVLSYLSARSPHDDRDSIGPDETRPVLEGFFIDGQTENGGLDNAGDMINLNSLDLPSTTSEHARLLEEFCKSASMQTPLSQLSSKFKVRGIQDLYQSVPNGLLERADLKSTLPLDMDAHKLRASYSCLEEGKTSLYGVPYSSSNSLSYSGTPFGWNSRTHYASPVGKLWERFSSGSSSSEKRLSSNPELTCFPIEEDPDVSEENENAEEADETQQDMTSRVLYDSGKRQPLVEITEPCLDPAQSISAAEKHPNRESLESVTTEFSFHGTHNRVKEKLRNHWSNKRSAKEGKENQTSLGAQSTKRGIKSLHSRFSKAKLSGKTSLRKGVERLSQKEPKHNNIVTGLTSFIPLVQQKQAVAVCPAKRDIKVKALEAAEAAKRLEEKRENERKMKKEALKIERARIEKENLREMELNKKKKQEELKKRDADMAARKRLREEDERKEKEKKRKRLGEGRREQKLADEKLRTGKMEKDKHGKMEKDKHGKMDEKVNLWKESQNPLEKKENIVNEGGDENCFRKPNTDPQSSYVLEDPDAASYCDNDGEQLSMLDKTAERNDSATVRSQEKSYDISPYQCSDDEEEEEDELPTTKCIPSWASADFVLPLQNKLDPDVIFPRESFCCMDEVLRPRRLQVK